MTTLSLALSNATAVMGHTDTQYLSRGFAITTNAAQKATPEDLVSDLQKMIHSGKSERERLQTAHKILITLSIIAPKQYPPESQAHFAKIKEIAIQALAPECQNNTSRAEYFQEKLSRLLFAKMLMISCGMDAHTGSVYRNYRTECLKAFKEVSPRVYNYLTPEDISSFALSKLLRINYLFEIENSERPRSLTNEELLELQSYGQLDDIEIKKITDDYTLMRKHVAALTLYNQSAHDGNSLKKLGAVNQVWVKKNEITVLTESLSAYYPAFDNYANFLITMDKDTQGKGRKGSESHDTTLKGLYEEHVTQLPAVHFAYRYFYGELTKVCSHFSGRSGMGFKKAYEGYEGNVLPAPDEFEKIEAVFPVVSLPIPSVEEKKQEAPSKPQPASSKKSKAAKSKKQSPRNEASPQPNKSGNAPTQTSSSNSSSSSTSSPSEEAEKEKDKKTLKKETLPFAKISYDSRVSLWFTSPEDCLSLPSYASLGEKVKEIAVYKHAFPIAFDTLLGTAYSVRETYQNTKQNQVDILFSIPGEIEYESSSKKMRGLFQYCFGEKDKVCYHRYFKEISTRELLQTEQYRKVFEEVEFPPLSTQTAPAQPRRNAPDQELVHEPLLNSYAVKDASHGLIFRAFKIRDLG